MNTFFKTLIDIYFMTEGQINLVAGIIKPPDTKIAGIAFAIPAVICLYYLILIFKASTS